MVLIISFKVVLFNEDTWYMSCGSSNDPGMQVL
jgi:hypothetical protein